jgi:polar amino acid transport system substrate-binding protein
MNILHLTRAIAPSFILTAAMSLACALAAGCAGTGGNEPLPLRVAVTPDYPPLVFESNGQLLGAEIDLAGALGRQLGRPVEFLRLRWDDLIPALIDGRADIIMSGMSVTQPRQVRVAFTEPYLRNQLRVIFPQSNADKFKTVEDVLNTEARIGVAPNTTGDTFVQKNCPRADRVPLRTRGDAAFYLLQGDRIDLYVDDTFALAQILSENEARVGYLKAPLAEDNLAWAVRPDDQQLLDSVNSILARWKADGTVNAILNRWMPYLGRYETQLQAGSTPGRP